jgi:hypothetical protein
MASAAAELVVEREPEPRHDVVVDANRTITGAEGLVRMALDQYTEILTTVSDPRVSDWPLMDSPIPTVVIVLVYLYSVTLLGPRLMANRKPFQLRNVLIAYNAFQVIFSLGMLYEVCFIHCTSAEYTQSSSPHPSPPTPALTAAPRSLCLYASMDEPYDWPIPNESSFRFPELFEKTRSLCYTND